MALFAVLLLVTMGATFIALATSEGRSSQSSVYAQEALHAANWGLDYAMNYMGFVGQNGHWQSTSLYKYTLKERTEFSTYAAMDGMRVKCLKRNDKDVDADGDNDTFFQLTFESPQCDLQLGNGLAARLTIDILDLGGGTNNTQPSQYLLVSTAQLYRGGNTNEVLATRTVEARIRESMASDYMHFIQQARAWDAQGVSPDSQPNVRDLVGLPESYTEQGKMRVDGGYFKNSDGSRGDRDPGNFVVYDTNGNNQFDKNKLDFRGQLTINGANNRFRPKQGQDQDIANEDFPNGVNANAFSIGLPSTATTDGAPGYLNRDKNNDGNLTQAGEQGLAYQLAKDSSLTGNNSEGRPWINGIVPPEGSGKGTNILGDSSNGMVMVKSSSPPSSPGWIEVNGDARADDPNADTRPGFAKIQVVLDGDKVSVYKIGKYSGLVEAVPGMENVKASQFKNGLLYVNGLNVEVTNVNPKTGATGSPFTGQLTVVNGENGLHNADSNGNYNASSIYHPAAAAYRAAHPNELPPYTAAQLGISGNSNARYYPPPASSIEREGNIIIGSDLKYGSDSAKLGLVAQNFVLLNDIQGDSTLRVDAVVMSVEHSVQFDWDNLAGRGKAYNAANRASQAHTQLLEQGQNRTFQLTGSIISRFMDVEGDVKGRGYITQSFTHDDGLKNSAPPFFPRWDRTNLPRDNNGNPVSGLYMDWEILHYNDRSAMGVPSS
jgi:hypothetical protein